MANELQVEGNKEFNPTTQTMIVETNDFCSMINGLFSPLFSDFIGSAIQMNSAGAAGNVGGMPVYPSPDGTVSDVPLNQYYATLIFKDRGELTKESTLLKNLVNLHPKRDENSSLANRFMSYSGTMSRSRSYDLNDETRDLLESFMIRSPYQKIDKNYWNRHVVEYAERTSTGPYSEKFVASVKVVGLDLNALVSKIFGDKDDEDNRVEYLVTPCIVPVVAGNTQNLLFQINRLDSANFAKVTGMLYGGNPLSATYVPVSGRI